MLKLMALALGLSLATGTAVAGQDQVPLCPFIKQQELGYEWVADVDGYTIRRLTGGKFEYSHKPRGYYQNAVYLHMGTTDIPAENPDYRVDDVEASNAINAIQYRGGPDEAEPEFRLLLIDEDAMGMTTYGHMGRKVTFSYVTQDGRRVSQTFDFADFYTMHGRAKSVHVQAAQGLKAGTCRQLSLF